MQVLPFRPFIASVLVSGSLAHATFSIAAVDSLTGEVGSAGGSCVDYVAGNLVAGRIGDVIPGKGAINSQGLFDAGNQINARARMLAGDSPRQIIEWLGKNDADGDNTMRQYGIVDYNQGKPRSAAFTGTGTDDYKGQLLGPNYSIQGNILLNASVLASMETRFRSEPGNLACKLMAALHGAKRPGADSRCAPNGTSTLYAYVKVAKPADKLDQPSFFVSVKTRDGARIEPVDTLQKLFGKQATCAPAPIIPAMMENAFWFATGTRGGRLRVICPACRASRGSLRIRDLQGRTSFAGEMGNELAVDITGWPAGLYFAQLRTGASISTRKVIKP
jgi:uncharacterized Ntn-hydrolase superfamily protein